MLIRRRKLPGGWRSTPMRDSIVALVQWGRIAVRSARTALPSSRTVVRPSRTRVPRGRQRAAIITQAHQHRVTFCPLMAERERVIAIVPPGFRRAEHPREHTLGPPEPNGGEIKRASLNDPGPAGVRAAAIG